MFKVVSFLQNFGINLLKFLLTYFFFKLDEVGRYGTYKTLHSIGTVPYRTVPVQIRRLGKQCGVLLHAAHETYDVNPSIF